MELSPIAVSAPAPAADFVQSLQSAVRSIGSAQMKIGSDWYGPGDTVIAMFVTRDALDAVELALNTPVAPGGHRTPTSAIEAARDGKAFLTRAWEIMDAEEFAPPVAARGFLAAAQRSLGTAISEYGSKLEPTPRYR